MSPQVDILLIQCLCMQVSLLTLPICHLQEDFNQLITTGNSHNFREVSLQFPSEVCLSSTTSTGGMQSISSSSSNNSSLLPSRLTKQPHKLVANHLNLKLQRRMHGSQQIAYRIMRVNYRGFQSSHQPHNSPISSHSTAIVSVSHLTSNPFLSLLPLNLLINLTLKRKMRLKKLKKMLRKHRN